VCWQVRPDFVKDRRRLKYEYDKYKVRINALPDLIRQRSDANNAREELEAIERHRQQGKEDDDISRFVNNQKATWMDDDSHWAGTWLKPKPNHMKGDHAGILQVCNVIAKKKRKGFCIFVGTQDDRINLKLNYKLLMRID
jgi:cellulose synthase-like protein